MLPGLTLCWILNSNFCPPDLQIYKISVHPVNQLFLKQPNEFRANLTVKMGYSLVVCFFFFSGSRESRNTECFDSFLESSVLLHFPSFSRCFQQESQYKLPGQPLLKTYAHTVKIFVCLSASLFTILVSSVNNNKKILLLVLLLVLGLYKRGILIAYKLHDKFKVRLKFILLLVDISLSKLSCSFIATSLFSSCFYRVCYAN